MCLFELESFFFFLFLDICPRVGLLGHMVVLLPDFFFKESSYCSPYRLYQFTFPLTVQEGSFFSIPSLVFIACRFFDDGHSDWPVIQSEVRKRKTNTVY